MWQADSNKEWKAQLTKEQKLAARREKETQTASIGPDDFE